MNSRPTPAASATSKQRFVPPLAALVSVCTVFPLFCLKYACISACEGLTGPICGSRLGRMVLPPRFALLSTAMLHLQLRLAHYERV